MSLPAFIVGALVLVLLILCIAVLMPSVPPFFPHSHEEGEGEER